MWARVVWNRIRNSRTHEPSRTRCYHHQSHSYETITILVCLAPSSIRQLNSRQCMKRRTAEKYTIGRKRREKMCMSNRKRKNIKLLYDLWYNEWVYGRTHLPEIAVREANTYFCSQFPWHWNAASCMGSPFNSKSIVTATPTTTTTIKTIVFPNCRCRWRPQALCMSSNEDREFPSFHLTLCDFQLRRMRMNRNVDSYRCECSFAIHHAITLKFRKEKMIPEFLCDIHTVIVMHRFYSAKNLTSMTMCHKDGNFHPSAARFFAHQPRRDGKTFLGNF